MRSCLTDCFTGTAGAGFSVGTDSVPTFLSASYTSWISPGSASGGTALCRTCAETICAVSARYFCRFAHWMPLSPAATFTLFGPVPPAQVNRAHAASRQDATSVRAAPRGWPQLRFGGRLFAGQVAQETMMPDAITGLWAAATTPSDAAGAIDHAALARHAQRLLHWGCDGLVLFGSCGEGPSFSIAERLAATEAVLRSGRRAGSAGAGHRLSGDRRYGGADQGHARPWASPAIAAAAAVLLCRRFARRHRGRIRRRAGSRRPMRGSAPACTTSRRCAASACRPRCSGGCARVTARRCRA